MSHQSTCGMFRTIYQCMHRKTLSINGGVAYARVTSLLYSTVGNPKEGVRQRVTYEQHLNQLLGQARKCVYIQHKGVVQDVLKACVKHGDVLKAFTVNKEDKHYMLVQFRKESSVKELMADAGQFPDRRESIPVESRHLYYANSNNNRRKKMDKISRKDFSTIRVVQHAPVKYEYTELQRCSSLSAQIETLYKKLSQRESDILLKAFLCVSLEETLKKILPSCQARPFGSFISGYGRYDSDVDLCMDIYGNSQDKSTSLKQNSMYFLTKRKIESDRNNVKNALDTMAGILQCFIPGYYNVNRILHARVPIIKLQHSGLQLECDVTLDRTGVVMSELLYNIGQLNPVVCPLVFSVRHWARQCELTRKVPGPWLSNYMLTMLVVYFLQNRPVPILPPLQNLVTLKDGDENDKHVEFQNIDSIKWDNQNTESLGDLLIGFFQFYGSLDFTNEGISVSEGTTVMKPVDYCALFMENPIDPLHNICKNVSEEELERFTNFCRTSSYLLKDCDKSKSNNKWGLLKVLSVDCDSKITDGFEKKISVTMEQLFKEEIGEVDTDNMKEATEL